MPIAFMKIKLPRSIWPPVVWSVSIFILLIIPGKNFPEGPNIPLLDKVIHAFLFGVQVFLWCRYTTYYNIRSRLWIFLLIFLVSCIYGIGMEYVQKYWVTNRGFEINDMVADIIGSFCGWMIYRFFFSKKQGAP